MTYRQVKQHLGWEDHQNGWWRGEDGDADKGNQPGPNPHEDNQENEKAVKRTVPFVFYTYGVVVLWYIKHGEPEKDVEQAQKRMPWYGTKEETSFADMLNRIRITTWKKKMNRMARIAIR